MNSGEKNRVWREDKERWINREDFNRTKAQVKKVDVKSKEGERVTKRRKVKSLYMLQKGGKSNKNKDTWLGGRSRR